MCCSLTSSQKPKKQFNSWSSDLELRVLCSRKLAPLSKLSFRRSRPCKILSQSVDEYWTLSNVCRMFPFVNIINPEVMANTLLHVRFLHIGCERTLLHWILIKCNLIFVYALVCHNLHQNIISTWNCTFTYPSRSSEYSTIPTKGGDE
jgi:hypothetical protein